MSDNTPARTLASPHYPYPSPPSTLEIDPTPADQAIYVPSVTPGFAVRVLNQSWSRALPQGLQPDDLNFLNPAQRLFQISHVMSSAGQALNQTQPCIITQRDRQRTRLICDSGGFQIAGGLLHIRGDHDRLRILRWQEQHADLAITLDVPTGPLLTKNPRFLYSSFRDCLTTTLNHLDFYRDNRVNNKIRFLNVLQGNDLNQADEWYQAVKSYPFEGWAFAGVLRHDIHAVCRRILIMANDGLLNSRNWIHVLGTCELDVAVMLTALQRSINKHINPNLRISFDTASPFKMLRFDDLYTLPKFDSTAMVMGTAKAPDHAAHIGSSVRWPWPSPIGDRMTMGDFCVRGRPSRNGYRDELSDDLMVHHNLAALCFGISLANRAFDGECVGQQHTIGLQVGSAVEAIERVIKSASLSSLAAHAKTFGQLRHSSSARNDTGDEDRRFE